MAGIKFSFIFFLRYLRHDCGRREEIRLKKCSVLTQKTGHLEIETVLLDINGIEGVKIDFKSWQSLNANMSRKGCNSERASSFDKSFI